MWAPSEHRKSSADAYIGAVTSGGVAAPRDFNGGMRWRPSDVLNEAVDPLSLPQPTKLRTATSVPAVVGAQRQLKQVAWAIEEELKEEAEAEVENNATGNSLVKASSAPSSTLEAAMEDARNSDIGALLLQPPAEPTQPVLTEEDLALPGCKKPEPIRTKAVAELVAARPPPPSPKRKLRETPIERRLSLGGKELS